MKTFTEAEIFPPINVAIRTAASPAVEPSVAARRGAANSAEGGECHLSVVSTSLAGTRVSTIEFLSDLIDLMKNREQPLSSLSGRA
jgi:hypothetical protein